VKKFLTVFFLVAISVSVMACADGDDGAMGLTGPSGVDALATTTCDPGEVLEATDDGSKVTWACVTPAE